MRTTAVYGTAMVVLATAVNLLHGVSHVGQEVLSLQPWQWAYVTCVIFLAPVVAAVLLWSPYRLAGAWLLFGSMAGSFVFDLAYHFRNRGPRQRLHPGAGRVAGAVPALVRTAGCHERTRSAGRWMGGAHALAPADQDTIRKPRGRREGTEMNEIMNPYVWRQRREDTMREAERDRLVRALRADRKKRTNRTFLLTWELRRMAGLLLKSLQETGGKKGSPSVTRLLLVGLHCDYPGPWRQTIIGRDTVWVKSTTA